MEDKIYPLLRRVQIRKEENSAHVGRIATDCFLINQDKKILAFGRVILNPLDLFFKGDDKQLAYSKAIGRAIEALHGDHDLDAERHGLPKFRRFSPIPHHADADTALKFLDTKTARKLEKLDLGKRKPLEFRRKNST